MRHEVAHRKLGRTTTHRLAMLRNMANSLIRQERIQTTLPKAKELRSFAEKLVTIGKHNDLAAKRRAFALLRDRNSVQKLFSQIAPSFEKRNGGYTRIYRLGYRVGDAAPLALIEYLQEDRLSAKVEGKVKETKPKEKKKESKKETSQKQASKSKL